jgi:hypothetical protein
MNGEIFLSCDFEINLILNIEKPLKLRFEMRKVRYLIIIFKSGIFFNFKPKKPLNLIFKIKKPLFLFKLFLKSQKFVIFNSNQFRYFKSQNFTFSD